MTPTELRQQADSLLQRGLYRRAATVLQLITAHPTATEAERDRAYNDAERVLWQHCQLVDTAKRDAHNAAQRARRAAAREQAAIVTGKRGDGMRAVQQRIREAQAARQQWKEGRCPA